MLTIRCLCAAFPTRSTANRFAGLSNMPNALPNTKSPMMSKTIQLHQFATFQASFHPSFSSPKIETSSRFSPNNRQAVLTLARMYLSKLLIALSLNAWLNTRRFLACCILSMLLCTLTVALLAGNAV